MIEEIERQVRTFIKQGGRSFLSVKFPRDFEVYFCALELCSFEGEMIDYFSFPIMPNTITKKEPYTSNIKKTFGGITVIKNSDFIPQEIIFRGNFGKSFKILGGKELVDFYGVSKYSDTEDYSKGTLNNVVKTGYGAIKYLQGILERSKIFDGNKRKPRILYLHNSTLGESYIVEPLQVQFEQSLQSNMVWNYNLNFSIIRSIDYGRAGYLNHSSKKDGSSQKETLKMLAIGSAIGPLGQSIGSSRIVNGLRQKLSQLL
jgi:hypothetical protein